MKKLIVLIILLCFAMVSCVTAEKASQPDRDICYFIISPYSGYPFPMCIEKGEFDKTEKERGYPIFGSYEEAMDFLQKLADEEKEGI